MSCLAEVKKEMNHLGEKIKGPPVLWLELVKIALCLLETFVVSQDLLDSILKSC